MRKHIIQMLAATLVAVGMLIGCDTNAKNVRDAREEVQSTKVDVLVAKQDLNKAIQDSTEDYRYFRNESEKRIADYENKIAMIKQRIANEKQGHKSNYERMLSDLERKNEALKTDLNEYREDGKDNWQLFKTKFNRNMDDLGQSISNFFVKEK